LIRFIIRAEVFNTFPIAMEVIRDSAAVAFFSDEAPDALPSKRRVVFNILSDT
jgi:hypothetical protein